MKLETRILNTDFLILGGGTAGCYAALTFCEEGRGTVLMVEKANIRRSGCLAAGVNALNAWITPGKTPQNYVDYARADAEGIVRGDLLETMAAGLNRVTARMEGLGLTILKNPDGSYAARGDRNLKINGENIKPLLAEAVGKQPRVTVLNQVNVFDYVVRDNQVAGVWAVDVEAPILYAIMARAVLCATGGAAGLYRPNHPGFSRHKLWYPPFNTGAGLAMGIRAGAEMTTLEMRFIALRCKDTIAPTGTLAQGVGAAQINGLGQEYEAKYGRTTSQRLYGTVMENLEGRGPCFLRTKGITPQQDEDLYRAYLNMAPSQTLKWLERGLPPGEENVEIEGTEPYITGGHTASGYWVNADRETTLQGLFAAGDVAGGCPQKYVTGAFVEGEIAAKAARERIDSRSDRVTSVNPETFEEETMRIKAWLEGFFDRNGCSGDLSENDENLSAGATDHLEDQMQAAMDEYAGGIGAGYRYSNRSLSCADEKIREIVHQTEALQAGRMQDLVYILELRERLTICRALLAHLAARKETRWPGFGVHTDYPQKDDRFRIHVNSRMEDGEIRIIFRDLVGEGETYALQELQRRRDG